MSSDAYVQALGEIAIHHPDGHTTVLGGIDRSIIALLVAAGPDGTCLTDIAASLWGPSDSATWLPSLERWIAQLQQQLPAGWTIVENLASDDPVISLRPATDGWIDAWRLPTLVSDVSYTAEDFEWMLEGLPYAELHRTASLASSADALHRLQLLVMEQIRADQALELQDG